MSLKCLQTCWYSSFETLHRKASSSSSIPSALLCLAGTSAYPPWPQPWTSSKVFLIPPTCPLSLLWTCPNSLSLVSLVPSPNYSTWALPLMYSFIILPILDTPKWKSLQKVSFHRQEYKYKNKTFHRNRAVMTCKLFRLSFLIWTAANLKQTTGNQYEHKDSWNITEKNSNFYLHIMGVYLWIYPLTFL